MINILIVSREQGNDKSFGLGKSIGAIAAELENRGHKTEYITVGDWDEREKEKYNSLVRLGGRIAKFFRFDACVIPALAERWLQGWIAASKSLCKDYSHIWFQDPWIVAGYLCRRIFVFKKNIAWGVSEHGLGSFTQAVILDGFLLDNKWTKLLLRIEKSILMKAHWVWTPSFASLHCLTRDMGLAKTPKHWRALGYGKPSLELILKETARRTLGWNNETIYIIAVGRLAPVKKYDIVIEALALAQQTNAELQLVIIGGEKNEPLVQKAREFKLKREPIFVFAENIDIYLSAADIYISACEYESFGMANMEAICAGLPCIIAAGGAATEVASYGGWLRAPSAVSLGGALSQMITNKQTREFWINAAKSRGAEYESNAALVAKYEKTLLDVVGING